MTDDDPAITSDQVDSRLHVTTQAINVFLASQKNDGTIAGIGYWQTGNGYTAMILHELWSQTASFVSRIRNSVKAIESTQPGFINEYNDDSMWWAMANLELFRLTNDATYLECMHNIWSHVKQYRLSKGEVFFHGIDMEGAVHWTSKDNETQLNTITTGLFAELSARLSSYYSGDDSKNMIALAEGSLSWIRRCRFDPEQYVVLDTIDYGTGEEVSSPQCGLTHTIRALHPCLHSPNELGQKNWTFTYTTGQTIAASVAIYETLLGSQDNAGVSDFLTLACDLALSAIHHPSWVDPDGTLGATEYPGQNSPWDNNDAVGFKSILLRSLTKLLCTLEAHQLDSNLQSALRGFIQQQFSSLTTRDTNGQGQYGPFWAGPFQAPTSHSQLAVLDAMAAVHAL
ncbi:hypothetical protein DV737_g4394, partial [Chaetothyriales sp. CBS 132003]